MRKAFEVTCIAALSAHSLSVDKFETSCNKVSISIWVFNNFLCSFFSNPMMFRLIAIQLMCNSSKEAILISTHIYQFQISFSKLFLQVLKELVFFFFSLCLNLFLIFSTIVFAKVVLNVFFILENFIFVKHAIRIFVDVIFLGITRYWEEIHFPINIFFCVFLSYYFHFGFLFLPMSLKRSKKQETNRIYHFHPHCINFISVIGSFKNFSFTHCKCFSFLFSFINFNITPQHINSQNFQDYPEW